MRAVLGIGNPGNNYSNTRHNIGFMLLDYLAGKLNLRFKAAKKDYYYVLGELNDSPFVFVKPTTYVNLSGTAALDIVNNYKIDIEDLLVICDDINLDTAQLRLKASGGDGGHNGVNSIIYHLESDRFPRLRFGIGRNFPQGKMADYVLSPFNKEEFQLLDNSFGFASELIVEFIKGGLKASLDYYSKSIKNLKPGGKETPPAL